MDNMKIGTLFGIGNMKASGTLASLVVLPVLYLFRMFGLTTYIMTYFLLLPFGIKICIELYKKMGDSSKIVLDEVIGVATMILLMGQITVIRLSFAMLLFRIFDIFKLWPISIWDNDKSEISIVADDMLAGTAAAMFVRFIAQ